MRTLRTALAVTLLALALPLNGCSPTEAAAAIRPEDTFLAAVGDTLKVTQFYRVSGSPDSVRWLFTARAAPSVIVSRVAPPNGVSLTAGPVNLIPSPALADGDTVTVSACPVAWKRATAYPGSCSTRLYTRPIIPPTVTGDSLTVVGMDVYPKGDFATTQATGACLRSYRATPDPTGWLPVWDAAANDWKPVCKGANGLPMIVAYCVAPIMGDSMRVLTAQWTTRPWCGRYTAQVPRRYTMPPGNTTKRQLAAEKFVTKLQARTATGVPMPGFVWDEPFGMTVVRDTTTPDAAMPKYAFLLGGSRSPPGRGGFAMPDSSIFLQVLGYTGQGAELTGQRYVFSPGPNSGTVTPNVIISGRADPRWEQYGQATPRATGL